MSEKMSLIKAESDVYRSHVEAAEVALNLNLPLRAETHLEAAYRSRGVLTELWTEAKTELGEMGLHMIAQYLKNVAGPVSDRFDDVVGKVEDEEELHKNANAGLWSENDGGRAKYRSGSAGDCVIRSVAIGVELDYMNVVELFRFLAPDDDPEAKGEKGGITVGVLDDFLLGMGWEQIDIDPDRGARVHEFTKLSGTYILGCQLGGREFHAVCVRDGKIEDTWNCAGYLVSRAFKKPA